MNKVSPAPSGPLRTLVAPAPGATRHDWVIDASVTAFFGLTVLIYFVIMLDALVHGSQTQPGTAMTHVLVFLAGAGFVLPLTLRRHYPLLMLTLITLAGLLQVIVSPWPMAPLIAVPVIAYSVARWVDGHASRLVLWVGLGASLLGPARWLFSNLMKPTLLTIPLYFVLASICFATVVTPYAVGRRLREAELAEQDKRAQELAQHRALLTQEAYRARAAEAASRAGIARELHDIVAHSLSVMIVQAEGGKALATKRPEAAAEVLGTIAETGREALVEARRIVALLRDGSDAVEYGPAPTLADIPELVARTGEQNVLHVHGTQPACDAGVGLTVYRVVQEALTNVLKHAGPHAHATVILAYLPRSIEVTVIDDGHGARAVNDGRGSGLRGMRERVAAQGGKLEAGPLVTGGFRVHAVIPLPYTFGATAVRSFR